MAIYHLAVHSKSKSNCKSIVSAAAYRSGDTLHDDRNGRSYTYKKPEAVYSEIMLPDYADAQYKDRQTLWNTVQDISTSVNAKYAVDIDVALSNDWTTDQCIDAVQEFCKQYTDNGYIVDFALHLKEGNYHAHILIANRKVDKKTGTFAKTNGRKVVYANDYQRDQDGNLPVDEKGYTIYKPIYNPDLPTDVQYRVPKLDENGNQKIEKKTGRKVWERVEIESDYLHDKQRVEEWRQSWAQVANKRLDKDQQIDHRSYRDRGIDKVAGVPVGQKGMAIHNRYMQGDNYRPATYVSYLTNDDIKRILTNYKSLDIPQAKQMVNDLVYEIKATGITRHLEQVIDRLDRGYVMALQQQYDAIGDKIVDLNKLQEQAKQAQQQQTQPKPQHKPKPKRQTTQTTVRLQDVLDEINTAKPTPQQVQAAQQIGDSRSVADLIGWARNEVANSKATKRKGIDFSKTDFADHFDNTQNDTNTRHDDWLHGDDDGLR